MALTLATFNAENLFLRYRFMEQYPGGRKPQKAEETLERDNWGFLPLYQKGMFQVFNQAQRLLTAQAIRGQGVLPALLCLQEVESLLALREFNERYLEGYYPYALVIDSRDFRQIDVGLLSRRPLSRVRSHVDDKTPDGRDYLFRRDCLEITIDLNRSGTRSLTLFLCHLKSKYVGKAKDEKKAVDRSNRLRLREAQAVQAIVRERFPGKAFHTSLFAVCGDFNDQPPSPYLKPLVQDLGLENAVNRLPPEERWTHWWASKNKVSQLDYILLSPALSHLTQGQRSYIERRGLGYDREGAGGGTLPKKTRLISGQQVPFDFPRFPGVTADIEASDHCPVFLELPLP